MTMTMDEAMAAAGFTRLLSEAKNPRLADISPHGDAQWKLGFCTVSLTNGSLGEFKGYIHYYDERDALVLNGILVPADARLMGEARKCMAALLDALRSLPGHRTLYLQACQIGASGSRRDAMSDHQLFRWYERLGFQVYSGGGRNCLCMKLGSAT